MKKDTPKLITGARGVRLGALFTVMALTASCSDHTDLSKEVVNDDSAVNLVALIGRRISVQPVEPKNGELQFDSEFRVRVEVLDLVYGKYGPKEMEFSSFVHVGPPAFAKDEFGLVYVSRKEGRYIQQKYLFQPVFKTSDGRWAGCGDPYDGLPDMHRHGVKAIPIAFNPPVTFSISKERNWHNPSYFQAPFFRIEGDVATCLMGNYPAELYKVMAEGYLMYRGVFGSTDK
jgi:hypothetical protein